MYKSYLILKMKLIKHFPLWLFSGILYGMSWPIFKGINLSFLAWFAFVPLFVYLEKNKNKFIKSILGGYAAMVIFGCFSAAWLFNFPQEKLKIAIVFFIEEIWFTIPFLFFYVIQKKIDFDKTLWLFPFIWIVWEWIYLNLEFTMGTHLSAYSQSNNLWLIQYIDITGMWGVSFWLMLFNVLIFKAYKEVNYSFSNILKYKKLKVIFLFMLGVPFAYGGYSYNKYNNLKGKSIQVSVIPTQYSAKILKDYKNSFRVVEETLRKTDSIAFNMKDRNLFSDLYLWPESGLSFTMQQSNLSALLFESVGDWKSALITGGRRITDRTKTNDKLKYVSGILISHKNKQPIYHNKTVLTPGIEAIPYHSFLSKYSKFAIKETDDRFFKKGEKSKPLKLITKENEKFLVGVSLCYEQWYPQHWAELAKNGANFYTHLAAEGWYGNIGFKSFMLNVTRMRTIENRKQTARSANIGYSGFIDQLGRFELIPKKKTFEALNKKITAFKKTTFYAEHQNWFPILCLVIFFKLFYLLYKIKPFLNNF